jgi:hypothetical protein
LQWAPHRRSLQPGQGFDPRPAAVSIYGICGVALGIQMLRLQAGRLILLGLKLRWRFV